VEAASEHLSRDPNEQILLYKCNAQRMMFRFSRSSATVKMPQARFVRLLKVLGTQHHEKLFPDHNSFGFGFLLLYSIRIV
jgi:hypothetical protein